MPPARAVVAGAGVILVSVDLGIDEPGEAPESTKPFFGPGLRGDDKLSPEHERLIAIAIPSQPEHEACLVSCCMWDMEGIHRPAAAHIPSTAFSPRLQKLWGVIQSGLPWNRDNEAEYSKQSGLSVNELLRIEVAAATGAGFGDYLRAVESTWRGREYQAIALSLQAPEVHLPTVLRRLEALSPRKVDPLNPHPFCDFMIPKPDSPEILLGNRYLSRGDGCILTGPSGMGKSSMVLQAACTWALGKDFFGIKPNGPLKSLIIQSEDSDGDIAEVWLSIRTLMNLGPASIEAINSRVLIVTDRIHRGQNFIDSARLLVGRHRPDLVWINPLLAYFDGDINDAGDAGRFLRGGLNGLNEPPKFAYMAVHHTAKPPTAKESRDRKWSEVMYDMTGSAELTNWPRAVISLRPMDNEGEFNLVFAKRGRRAGATYTTGEADQYEVVGTTIPVKHTSATIPVEGHEKPMAAIFWERRKASTDASDGSRRGPGGSAPKHVFSTYRAIFPTSPDHAEGLRRLHGRAKELRPIGTGAFVRIIDEGLETGIIKVDTTDPQRPKYWVSTK